MKCMEKKGQFFLVAGIIVASIFFGLGIIYTSVDSPKKDTRVERVASEFKYEGSKILELAEKKEMNFVSINSSLADLAQSYAFINPDLAFVVWMKAIRGENSTLFFEKGKLQDVPTGLKIAYYDNWTVLDWDIGPGSRVRYSEKLLNGSNTLYVLVKKEDRNARTISVK